MAAYAAAGYKFDFDMFDRSRQQSSAAPKLKPRPQPTLVPARPRSRAQLRREAKRARLAALKILTVSSVLLLLLGMLIYGRVMVEEYRAQAQTLETQYKEAVSENVRLESTVASMYSIDNIAEYAEDKLGMIKKDDYQINYYSVD